MRHPGLGRHSRGEGHIGPQSLRERVRSAQGVWSQARPRTEATGPALGYSLWEVGAQSVGGCRQGWDGLNPEWDY